jgi:hypothetical protein
MEASVGELDRLQARSTIFAIKVKSIATRLSREAFL